MPFFLSAFSDSLRVFFWLWIQPIAAITANTQLGANSQVQSVQEVLHCPALV